MENIKHTFFGVDPLNPVQDEITLLDGEEVSEQTFEELSNGRGDDEDE